MSKFNFYNILSAQQEANILECLLCKALSKLRKHAFWGDFVCSPKKSSPSGLQCMGIGLSNAQLQLHRISIRFFHWASVWIHNPCILNTLLSSSSSSHAGEISCAAMQKFRYERTSEGERVRERDPEFGTWLSARRHRLAYVKTRPDLLFA